MAATFTPNEEAQLHQTIEMFEVITQSQPQDYQSLEILKEAYFKLGRETEVIKTSKRIAEAYVHMGQLSSAILEYESILQSFPGDPDVQKALQEIESKANKLADGGRGGEPAEIYKAPEALKPGDGSAQKKTPSVDDGRQLMRSVFVSGKVISDHDFDMCWPEPNLSETPRQPRDPFIHLLSEQGILPVETSLKVLCAKARMAFLSLEKYDVDVELIRSFPRDVCLRWCVLPFDRMSKSTLVATANPFNKQAAVELEKAAGGRLLWYLVPPFEILKILRKTFRT
ncbi:MAG: hypothetical protein HY043_07840 [Verrucomicrobia bacterium]|nr:hypothetical protein [Verrucomicrobiota bacterium]